MASGNEADNHEDNLTMFHMWHVPQLSHWISTTVEHARLCMFYTNCTFRALFNSQNWDETSRRAGHVCE